MGPVCKGGRGCSPLAAGSHAHPPTPFSSRYSAEIGGAVSGRTRKTLIERAAQLGVVVSNGKARLKKQEVA